MQEQLGFRLSEHIVMDDGREAGAWLRVASKSYDLVFTQAATIRPPELLLFELH